MGEKKEGEETIEEASEVDVSTTTAEKKTLMQKLMTIKRDLMANKKEEKTEPKKVHLLQKLFGKRKDFVVPKIDEVAKTDKEIINEEEKTEEKPEEEKEEKEEKEK